MLPEGNNESGKEPTNFALEPQRSKLLLTYLLKEF